MKYQKPTNIKIKPIVKIPKEATEVVTKLNMNADLLQVDEIKSQVEINSKLLSKFIKSK